MHSGVCLWGLGMKLLLYCVILPHSVSVLLLVFIYVKGTVQPIINYSDYLLMTLQTYMTFIILLWNTI